MKKKFLNKKVFDSLKKEGERITRAREEIIKTIFLASHPVTALEILESLKKKGLHVNKTTVYRELDFLLEKKILSEISLETGVKHFEAGDLPHHHHLICNSCGDITEIVCDELEEPMEEVEKRALSEGFKIKRHMLEFYGLCSNCLS